MMDILDWALQIVICGAGVAGVVAGILRGYKRGKEVKTIDKEEGN